MFRKAILIIIVGVCAAKFCSAQTAYNLDPYKNPVILAHYDSTELYTIGTTDTAKFNAIVYYFTQSFILEHVDCADCVPADLSTFDVQLYEKQRLKSERFIRDFTKHGYKLTLLSFDELLYKLPFQIAKWN